MTPEVTHHQRGRVKVVGQSVDLSRTPATYTTAAPDAGEHNDELLRELGFGAAEIARLKKDAIV